MRDFTIALPSQSKVTEKIQPKDTVCINRNSGIYQEINTFTVKVVRHWDKLSREDMEFSFFGYVQTLADMTLDNIIQL